VTCLRLTNKLSIQLLTNGMSWRRRKMQVLWRKCPMQWRKYGNTSWMGSMGMGLRWTNLLDPGMLNGVSFCSRETLNQRYSEYGLWISSTCIFYVMQDPQVPPQIQTIWLSRWGPECTNTISRWVARMPQSGNHWLSVPSYGSLPQAGSDIFSSGPNCEYVTHSRVCYVIFC
jgi:hypothetical protein